MLARIRLKPLIIGSALTITLCTIFQGGAAVWSSNELGRQLHVATDNSLKSVALLSEMRGDMFRIQSQLAQLILAETPEGAKAIEAKIEENITEVDGNFDTYEHLVSDETEAKLFADLRDKWARWTMSIDAVSRDALNQQEQDARNGLAMKQGPASQELEAALNKELQYNQVLAKKAADEGDRASKLSLASNILFTAISVLASLAILVIFVRRVTSPMTRLTETMQHMAGGAFDIDVPCTEKKDELGDMANALGDIRTGIADWSRGEAEKREKVQRQVVTALGEGLTAMKDGNLVYRIDTPFPSAYEGLRADFNKALEELAGVIRAVTETTQSVRSGSTEISSATDDLSQRTERQAASLEETAAAVDQLTATVGETAQAAASASAAANSAQKDAVDSSRIVDEAVTAMESIARSSQQMEAIVAMIDGVAFQTNLLALNAGIEAARAGDAGNGFAVVANEVRALAQRSAAAAQEIKGLITASGEQVNAGVELVNTAGTTLARICENATEVSSLVAQIAQSAQEQASSIRQVNEVVRDLDTITQQNAALVEESTAASRQLAGQAVGLATMVDRFRVGGSAARSAPAGRTAAAARSAPRATRAASAPTVASTGNAALKLDTVSDAGADWDEF